MKGRIGGADRNKYTGHHVAAFSPLLPEARKAYLNILQPARVGSFYKRFKRIRIPEPV